MSVRKMLVTLSHVNGVVLAVHPYICNEVLPLLLVLSHAEPTTYRYFKHVTFNTKILNLLGAIIMHTSMPTHLIVKRYAFIHTIIVHMSLHIQSLFISTLIS